MSITCVNTSGKKISKKKEFAKKYLVQNQFTPTPEQFYTKKTGLKLKTLQPVFSYQIFKNRRIDTRQPNAPIDTPTIIISKFKTNKKY